MKKLSFVSVAGIALLLAGCGSSNSDSGNQSGEGGGEEPVELRISASNVPHAEILEEAVPFLEEEGIELDIVIAEDYIIPNIALNDGSVDANFFQHKPYLDNALEENEDFDFVSVGAIHLEPMALYSLDYNSPEELPDGAEIIISNNVAEHGRVLSMLEQAGLITLTEDAGVTATEEDIVENPKNLSFRFDVNPEVLPQAYFNGEGDAVFINANYALDADLVPAEDSIYIEEASDDNPYVNLIVVNQEDENNEAIQTLVEVLKSDEIKAFIEENYDGAVIPAE